LPEWQFVWPDGHNRVISAPLIIPTPEIFTTEITAEDSYIIMGSDGLWDVITSDLACKRVNDLLLKNQLTLDEIAEDMCQLAIRLGSEDNITCIIVVLEHDNIISGY
jgi:serine/threonine protein phosphatase PrpC